MVTISFFLKNPKANKSPIYISVHVHGKRIVPISIGESVRCDKIVKGKLVPGDWDKVKQRVRKSHDFAPEINNKIENIYLNVGRTFRQMLADGQRPNANDLQDAVKPNAKRATKDKNKEASQRIDEVYEQWVKWYIAKSNRGIPDWEKVVSYKQKGYNTTRTFKSAVDKITEFSPTAELKDFLPKKGEYKTSVLLDDLMEWVGVEYPDLQDVSLRKFPNLIRTLLKYVGLPSDWVESISIAKPTKFSLKWDELLQLDNFKYKNPENERSAHAAVIISQLALRWGDIESLKPQHFIKIHTKKHGEIYCVDKNQEKTGNPVLVPVPALALKRLTQYNFTIPVPKTSKDTSFRHHFGTALKEAAAEAKLDRLIRQTKVRNKVVSEEWKPLHELISPHALRHTGATLLRVATKSNDLPELLLGHKPRTVTAGYVHMEPELIADDILDAWEYFTK